MVCLSEERQKTLCNYGERKQISIIQVFAKENKFPASGLISYDLLNIYLGAI